MLDCHYTEPSQKEGLTLNCQYPMYQKLIFGRFLLLQMIVDAM
uniref:Uncharacterized protein n=1 Tax=Siphoviridae sp. ctYh54 TaxID=2826379 RepID=A0A8S5ME58_9CAUD|nr:MAG TPA: hypothetical protein [Siphoviridae sp. ctYh54]